MRDREAVPSRLKRQMSSCEVTQVTGDVEVTDRQCGVPLKPLLPCPFLAFPALQVTMSTEA